MLDTNSQSIGTLINSQQMEDRLWIIEKIKRDFIYIEDVIQANILACNPESKGIFNVGTGISRSFQDVSEILQKEIGSDLKVEYFPNPHNGYQLNTQANINSAITELEFSPKFSLEEGIKSYLPEIINLHKTN